MNTKAKRVAIRSDGLLRIMHAVENELKRSDIWPSCISCVSWDQRGEFCKKYRQRPPAHIIVNACPDYFDDEEIPF